MQLESAILSTRLSLCARVPNQNLAEKEVYLTLDASSLSYCILVHLWCVSPSPYVLITQEYHMSSAEASSFYKYFSGDLFSQNCWKKSYLFPSKHWFQGWAVSAHQECHFLDFGIRKNKVNGSGLGTGWDGSQIATHDTTKLKVAMYQSIRNVETQQMHADITR